jgi:hypothetical protein
MSKLFYFFLEAFIYYFTIKEKEIANTNILWYRSYMGPKISAFDK